jgi:hypothetical protein
MGCERKVECVFHFFIGPYCIFYESHDTVLLSILPAGIQMAEGSTRYDEMSIGNFNRLFRSVSILVLLLWIVSEKSERLLAVDN